MWEGEISDELVDTYGGDYTYRVVWCSYHGDGYTFYQRYDGAKSSPTEKIDDAEDIAELMEFVNEKNKVNQ